MPIHADEPVMRFGAETGAGGQAEIAMIMLHGRGATADDISQLAEMLPQRNCAFAAPQASGNAWYPQSFLRPRAENEPHLSSALAVIDRLVLQFEAEGIPAERVLLLGFSQGACLSCEYAARNPRRYGGVLALAGGLIGEAIDPGEYHGSLEGTPVFIGCSDQDPYIPVARLEKSAQVLRSLGGEVSLQLYPGLPHTVNEDELKHVRAVMASAAGWTTGDHGV